MSARNLEEKWKSGDMEITMRNYTLAKIAYDAYYKQAGGKSLATGDTLPEFLGLSEAIQEAWYEASEAVRMACGHGQQGEDSGDAMRGSSVAEHDEEQRPK